MPATRDGKLRGGIERVLGVVTGAGTFFVVSQVSSPWLGAASESSRAASLALGALVGAAAVALAGRRPVMGLTMSATMLALAIAGYVGAEPPDLQGPTSVLQPWRLVRHGGQSVLVLGLTGATFGAAWVGRADDRKRAGR